MIELTEQQRQAVKKGEAVRLRLPEIEEEVVLLSATQYLNMQEELEDQREQDVGHGDPSFRGGRLSE